jgi:hypothetical protein
MEGDVAAAVDLMQLDAALGEELGRGEHVVQSGVAAQRDDRRMFQQEERVPDAVGLAQLQQRALQFERRKVRDQAEMENVDDQNQLSAVSSQLTAVVVNGDWFS